MLQLMFLGGIGLQEILIIAFIVLLLFGGKKIPELMKGLGKGVRSFKDGVNSIEEETKKELEDRIYRYFDEINKEPVPYKWTYKMDTIDLSKEDIDSIVYEVVNAKAASSENKTKKAPKTISRKRKSVQN